MTAAVRHHRMNVEEFLDWNDGSDRRYELIDGMPVAQAHPSQAHAVLQAAVAGELRSALKNRRPCRVAAEAGIRPLFNTSENYRQADVAVTCRPFDPSIHHVQDPVLIVEILSPSTEREDRLKLHIYAALPSVREIVLLDSRRVYAEVYRRRADGMWQPEPELLDQGSRLRLDSIDAEIDLDILYADLQPG